MAEEKFDWRVTVEVSDESHAYAGRKFEVVGTVRCEPGEIPNYGIEAARRALLSVAGQVPERREGYGNFAPDGVGLAASEAVTGGKWSSLSNS